MQRALYKQLLAWKVDPKRKPLILQGARQVGKTYLLKQFGKAEYQYVIYLNFEFDPRLGQFFADRLDPKQIIENLSIYIGQSIQAEDTLIIFDEIQECPNALNSLKYFQEQANEYHIAAAGSLLGVKLANEKGFPVGKVNFYNLLPLNFFEFLNAVGKDQYYQYLTKLTEIKPLPEPIHNELIELLKKYFFVGGMPEAVATYIETNDFSVVRRVQNEILNAYMLDFAKHAPSNQLMKITAVWEMIPSQLAKENKKFTFSALSKSARARDYEVALQWLADASLIYKTYNIKIPKLPLDGYSEKNIFKVFFLDVGLLAAMSKIPPQIIIDGHQLFSEFNGAFTENYVAQELTANYSPLYYWSSEGTAEVDFIIANNNEIFPLEVKAGISKKKKSLIVYGEKYKSKKLFRSTLMNLLENGNIVNYPLYLVERFPQLQ